MLENPLWNLLTKLFSFLAIILLLLGAGLVGASHLGWTQNQFAGVLTVFFAAFFAVFSLAAVNLSNSKLNRGLRAATETAHQLAQGELLDEDFESRSDLFDSLNDISLYLREKGEIINRIAAGDFSQNIQLRSDDDYLGHSFQNIIDKLHSLAEAEKTRELLEKSITRVSRDLTAAAAGDLTAQAKTSGEIPIEAATAFNSVMQNLRSLIKQVRDVSFKVDSSTHSIFEATGQLARGSEAQNSQISLTTEAISNMALQIQGVSENADLSAQVAADSLGRARFGRKAAGDNINAMNAIRKQVKETARRIKRLGERSQEIGQIVQLIEDLSERTGLLALNASLQASAENQAAGDGFAAHAEEVERLAERSNRLTQQIAVLTQSIQTETKDVIASMEETIHQVVVGSALADKAGQALVEIEQVSNRLAELIKSISASAAQQAASAEDISKAMANVSNLTELVQTEAHRTAESVKTLVELSEKLRGSVTPFKLPEDESAKKSFISENNQLFIN